MRKALVSIISLLPLLSLESVIAAPANSPSTVVAPPKKVCKIAQTAEQENPAAVEKDKITGTVYSVVGDVVMVELDGGGNRHVALNRREVGHMGQLVGRRVTITPFFCNRINLTPRPVVTPAAIEVPKIESRPSAPETIPVTPPAPTPAPTPVPEAAPAPAPAPTIIPQTW